MKIRMSSLDVAGEVACLKQRLLGLRVANVYDLNSKTYVLKMARSGEDGEKIFLLLESGSRFHTSEVMGAKSDIPSNFTLKLRKHMRTRRLEDVRQLGVDRIVDFVFGSGEAQYHLILEMYSQGNVILTDSKYEVLTLLRSHRDDDKGFAIMAKHPYPMQAVRLRTALHPDDLAAAFVNAAEGSTMKAALAAVIPYGPAVAAHVIADAGLDAGAVVPHPGGLPQDQLDALLAAGRRLEGWFTSLETSAPKGFITWEPAGQGKAGGGKKKKKQEEAEVAPEPTLVAEGDAGAEVVKLYNDFNPLLLQQSKAKPYLEFENFDKALDNFFSSIAGQRATVAKADAERAAMGKLDRMKEDQSKRVTALEREATESEERASLIEYNLDAVDAAIAAVNGALATGMDWHDLDRMIKDERKAGNPVAGLIHSLQLDQNTITLMLSNFLDDGGDGGSDDDEAMTRPASKVSVDLALTAFSNASAHYSARKKHVVKQEKTLAANEQALKAAEKKALQQLQKVRDKRAPVAPRKQHWFERFNWFVSSENYLIISGRDAQQNELIVKRYFKKGDAYVHADLHGASSTIVKNPTPEVPLPPLTLQQAGCACVCRSKAWDSKMVTSAWWVHHHQVSKTAPTGEYLTTGSFMVRGKKNFLPPQPLVFGFGFMFKLEPGCIASHIGMRAVRSAVEGDGASVMPHDDDEVDEVGLSDLDINSGEDVEEGGEDGSSRVAGSVGAASRTTSTTSALDRFLEGSMDPMSKKYKKYGLDLGADEASTIVESIQPGSSTQQGQKGQGKRHLSAKERELMKKGGESPPPQTQGVGGDQGRPGSGALPKGGDQGRPESGAPPKGGDKGSTKGPVPPPPVGRGKKAKLQRAKDKYADQDEEEREMALQLLASQGTKKSRADRQMERKVKKEAKRKAIMVDLPGVDEEEMQVAIRNALGREFKQDIRSGDELDGDSDLDSEDGDEGKDAAEVEADKAVASEAKQNEEGSVMAAIEETGPPATVAEQAEIKALMAEENITEMTEEDKEKLTVLDSLTAVPRADDTILFAVPVCGPYNALQGYKFKVKLIPGTQKKGKAARQALELLVRGTDVTPHERDLMKASPEMDAINAMVGLVKISMPGLQKLKMNEKKDKKSKAKAAAQGKE